MKIVLDTVKIILKLKKNASIGSNAVKCLNTKMNLWRTKLLRVKKNKNF